MSSAELDSKKRKRNSIKLKAALAARKRAKLSTSGSIPSLSGKRINASSSSSKYLSLSELPWKEVVRPEQTGFDDDGMLMLEEIEGVEVVYEEGNTDADAGGSSGRVVKFRMANGGAEVNPTPTTDVEDMSDGEDDEPEDENSDEELKKAGSSKSTTSASHTTKPELPSTEEEDTPFDAATLPEWHAPSLTSSTPLHPILLRSLHAQNFLTPTPIQAAAIPVALAGRDIVGVAETGSGKTLAYGLPILHHLLSLPQHPPGPKQTRVLRALVLAPTRELALQVADHITTCVSPSPSQTTPDPKVKGGNTTTTHTQPRPPPRVSVAAIVGGMSAQKQRRILARGVDVLVCTPGRLWDLLSESDELASQLAGLRFLVLDEADRMIETGHFAELENILRLTLRPEKGADEKIPEDGASDDSNSEAGSEPEPKEASEVDDNAQMDDGDDEDSTVPSGEQQMQTFVFSATLSKDLQHNLKRRTPRKRAKKGPGSSTLDDLVMRLDFRDPNPEVIDLSPVGGAVETLKQAKVECLSADKDVYLYYFLLRYPGRALVFLSSIDGIRRALPLLEHLGLKAFPLHSQLEQKQRLKNLDRFKSTPNAILLATDIAARGLDIPAVAHVIHYQLPRSADTYVHRNGRTARAKREGFSLLMCAPDDRKVVRALLGVLGRKEEDIPPIAIELDILDKLKERVQIARKLENAQHKVKKANHERNWLKETAEALELELDSDFASASDEDNPHKKKKDGRKDGALNARQSAKTASLKAELKQLLAQPLIARGVSARYITSGSRPIVEDLLRGEQHGSMLGVSKSTPGKDLLPARRRFSTKRKPGQGRKGKAMAST